MRKMVGCLSRTIHDNMSNTLGVTIVIFIDPCIALELQWVVTFPIVIKIGN